jgi:hypothetical protein
MDDNDMLNTADAPAAASAAAEVEIADSELLAAFAESIYNGKLIDWKYWAEQMPVWTAAQAARLMCALDPDVFEDLGNRPNRNDPSDLTRRAMEIQRLADAQSIPPSSPLTWLGWADRHALQVHVGTRIAINALADDSRIARIFDSQEAHKLAAGRYTLEEAAAQIGAAGGARADQMLAKLMDAARTGVLTTYAPGATARYVYGPGRANPVRDFYEEVYWDDLNRWIEENEPRLLFSFGPPSITRGEAKADDIARALVPLSHTGRAEVHASVSISAEATIESARPIPPVIGVASPRAEQGLKRREQQIQAIESAIHALEFTALCIPTGGKKKLMIECKTSDKDLFGTGDDPFLAAWKEAVENHNQYARR